MPVDQSARSCHRANTMNTFLYIRRLSGTIAAAFLVGWWSLGCIKVDQTLSLKEDGSGTLAVRYGMSLNDLAEMDAMAKSQVQAGEEAPPNMNPFEFDEATVRKDFEEYASSGVTLLDVRTEEVDGWKYLSLRIGFTSLEGLGKTEFLSDRMVTLKRLPDGNYEFTQAAPPAPPEADMAGMEEMMASMMKGFRAALKIELPGDVVETNADSKKGRAVEWIFDLDKDAKALRRAQNMSMRVVFKGDGLTLPEFAGSPVSE